MAEWDGDGMGGAPWQTDGAAAWSGYGGGLVFGKNKKYRKPADNRFWSTDQGQKVKKGIIESVAQGNGGHAKKIAREVEAGNGSNAARLAQQVLNNREGMRNNASGTANRASRNRGWFF